MDGMNLNPKLTEQISAHHRQEIAREFENVHLAQEIKSAQGKRSLLSPLRAVLIALINLITR